MHLELCKSYCGSPFWFCILEYFSYLPSNHHKTMSSASFGTTKFSTQSLFGTFFSLQSRGLHLHFLTTSHDQNDMLWSTDLANNSENANHCNSFVSSRRIVEECWIVLHDSAKMVETCWKHLIQPQTTMLNPLTCQRFRVPLPGASGGSGASGSGAWHSSTSAAASRLTPQSQVQKCCYCRENTVESTGNIENHGKTTKGPLQMTSKIKQNPSCSELLGINQISIELSQAST